MTGDSPNVFYPISHLRSAFNTVSKTSLMIRGNDRRRRCHFFCLAWLACCLLSAITSNQFSGLDDIATKSHVRANKLVSEGLTMAKTFAPVGYKTPTHIQQLQLLCVSSGIIITQRNQHVILSDVVHEAVSDEHAVHAGVLLHSRLLGLLLPGVRLGPKQPLCPTRSPHGAEGQDPRLPPPAGRSRQLHHQDNCQT